MAGLKKPVSREFKWDNALTPTASEQLEEGIADPGLILETSVIRMGKLNRHFPAAWSRQQETDRYSGICCVKKHVFVTELNMKRL